MTHRILGGLILGLLITLIDPSTAKANAKGPDDMIITKPQATDESVAPTESQDNAGRRWHWQVTPKSAADRTDDPESFFSTSQYKREFSTRYSGYEYLFDPSFIYNAQATGKQITQSELSYLIANAYHYFTGYAKQHQNAQQAQSLSAKLWPETQPNTGWNNAWLYEEALKIYLHNGIQNTEAEQFELHTDSTTAFSVAQAKKIQTHPFYGTTPLHLAIVKGDKLAFQMLLEAFSSNNRSTDFSQLLNAPDAYGHTPLHLALRVWAGTHETKWAERIAENFIRPLLYMGAEPNTRNTQGETVLHTMMRLHSRQHDIAPYMEPPFIVMAAVQSVDVSPHLLELPDWFVRDLMPKIDPALTLNAQDQRGHTPLIKLALSWSEHKDKQKAQKVLQLFVTHGAELNATDEYGRSIRMILDETFDPHGKGHYLNPIVRYVHALQYEDRPGTPTLKDSDRGPLSFSSYINLLTPLTSVEKSFLNRVYNNTSISDFGFPRPLSLNNHITLRQAFWFAAKNNLTVPMQSLLLHMQQAGDAYPDSVKNEIVAKSLTTAVRNDSRDVVKLLFNEHNLNVDKQLILQAVHAQSYPMLEALARISFESIQSKAPQKMSASYFFDSFPSTALQRHWRKQPSWSEGRKHLDALFSGALIPAIKTQNKKIIQYIIHLSPSSLHQQYERPFDNDSRVRRDTIFHIALQSERPQPDILKTLLHWWMQRQHKSPTTPALLPTRNLEHALSQIGATTARAENQTVWTYLAYRAARNPEHIGLYQNIFSQFMEAIAAQRFTAFQSRQMEAIAKQRGPAYPQLSSMDSTPDERPLFSPKDANDFIDMFRRTQAAHTKNRSADVVRAHATQLEAWEKLLVRYTRATLGPLPAATTPEEKAASHWERTQAFVNATQQCDQLLTQAQ